MGDHEEKTNLFCTANGIDSNAWRRVKFEKGGYNIFVVADGIEIRVIEFEYRKIKCYPLFVAPSGLPAVFRSKYTLADGQMSESGVVLTFTKSLTSPYISVSKSVTYTCPFNRKMTTPVETNISFGCMRTKKYTH